MFATGALRACLNDARLNHCPLVDKFSQSSFTHHFIPAHKTKVGANIHTLGYSRHARALLCVGELMPSINTILCTESWLAGCCTCATYKLAGTLLAHYGRIQTQRCVYAALRRTRTRTTEIKTCNLVYYIFILMR